jgi:hypothetical protein
LLDWALNGVPVYIRKSVSGEVYATTCDFSQFLIGPPLETVRIRVDEYTPAGYDCATDPVILRKLKEYNS